MSLLKRLFGGQQSAPQAAVSSPPSAASVVPATQQGAMLTLDSNKVVEPFAKVVYWLQADGGIRIRAYVLMERTIEGAQTGIALDGSGSMNEAYGFSNQGQQMANNIISPLAQKMCSYLARQLDADGGTTAIYWATGDNGNQVEVIGDLTSDQAETYLFRGPAEFGSSTRLQPAVQYFVERFEDADWGMYIFVTDGEIHDLDDVARYTTKLAREIAAGRRNKLKMVLIGVGNAVNEAQMEALDNLETGTNVDLWDHKIAAQMQHLAEIFAEVVDEATIVAPSGLIRDEHSSIVRDYRDTGVPALLEFVLPAGSRAFSLEINGQMITQALV